MLAIIGTVIGHQQLAFRYPENFTHISHISKNTCLAWITNNTQNSFSRSRAMFIKLRLLFLLSNHSKQKNFTMQKTLRM